MESIWPENRIRAGLPSMAYPLYGHGGAGFKPGNELHGVARRGARLLRTAPRRPGSGPGTAGNDSSSPTATALRSIPLRGPRIGQEP